MAPKKSIEELIAAEEKKRQAAEARIRELEKQLAAQAKAEREKHERRMGRLCYQAGLHEVDDKVLLGLLKNLSQSAVLNVSEGNKNAIISASNKHDDYSLTTSEA